MTKTLYTAIIGNYDKLFPVPAKFRKGWDLKCFTDQKHLGGEGWEIAAVERNGLSDVAFSKKIKILPHEYLPGAEASLWIDASYKVLGPLNEFVSLFDKKEFAVFEHPDRSCVYEEMDAIIRLNKAHPIPINRQRQTYLEMGIPPNGGLYRCGVVYRRKAPAVVDLDNLWWTYTLWFATWRDQLTLPLALWVRGQQIQAFSDQYLKKFFRQRTVHHKEKAA